MRRNNKQPSKQYKYGYIMRNVKTRARKTSRVFPEVSGSRDSPLVLVEAPSQGLNFPLILASTKWLIFFTLKRRSPNRAQCPRKSLRLRQPIAPWTLTKRIRPRLDRGSRSPRVTSKASLEGSLARALSTQGR